jgi:hypothetical protein
LSRSCVVPLIKPCPARNRLWRTTRYWSSFAVDRAELD